MPEVPKLMHFVTKKPSQKSASTNHPIETSAEMATRVKRWVNKNPGWKALIWCDPADMGQNHAVAAAQDPNVEVKSIDVNAVPGSPTNPDAAADALRYQILLKHGGCYIDSDVEPGDPLPALNVSDSSALFARATPSGPRNTAIACTIGSQRIQAALGQAQADAQGCTMASSANQKKAVPAVAPGEEFPEKCIKASAG